MTVRVVCVDPTTDPRWDALVSHDSEGRIWHTSLWLEVLRRAYGYTPVHLASETDGALDGVLPLLMIRSRLTGRRLVSLPFSGPAGPVGTTPETVERLAEAATAMMSRLGCGYVNIQINGTRRADAFPRFELRQPFVRSVLPLRGSDGDAWRDIPTRSVRREIERGRQGGVSVTLATDRRDLRAFYDLFVRTSRRHGIPPQPYGLFEAMWDIFEPRGMLQLFLAAFEGRLINAMVCLSFKDVLSAVYVGTDYRFLRHHPVKITDWAAIKWACERGCRLFDFMQSHVQNHGLRWYKRSFGAVEQPIAHYYYPRAGSAAVLREVLVGQRSPIAKTAKALVRRLPSTGLKLLGNAVFRHMG